MLDNIINLVASYYDISTKDRIFLSKNVEYFEPISMQLINDNKTINMCLDELIHKSTDIPTTEHYMYNLLSINKTQNIININYAVLLPNKINLVDNVYKIKSNIATIDPLVRKAISYV